MLKRMFKHTLAVPAFLMLGLLAGCDESRVGSPNMGSAGDDTGAGGSSSLNGANSSSSTQAGSDDGFSLIQKPFDYQSLMINYADNLIMPTYDNFSAALTTFNQALETQCALLAEGTVSEESTQNTQQAGLAAMAHWQQAELMWVGPAATNDNALRNRIYSFATTAQADPCAIDIATIEHNSAPITLETRTNTVRGLDALEYLLFEPTLNTACSSAINQTANWNNQTALARQQQRCNFAKTIAIDVQNSTQTLVNAWALDGDNYRSLFINPNNAGPHLKALSDAIFYIEKEVKDIKLGTPLAQISNCVLEACPKLTESRFAKTNGAWIVENLQAFKLLFNGISVKNTAKEGVNGVGFDDIIRYEGFDEVSASLNKKVDAAITMAKQLIAPNLLIEQAQNQLANQTQMQCQLDSINAANGEPVPPSFCALHGLIQAINLQMRTDFITIVNVDLPVRAQSDND